MTASSLLGKSARRTTIREIDCSHTNDEEYF